MPALADSIYKGSVSARYSFIGNPLRKTTQGVAEYTAVNEASIPARNVRGQWASSTPMSIIRAIVVGKTNTASSEAPGPLVRQIKANAARPYTVIFLI